MADPSIHVKFARLSVIKYALKEAKSLGYLKNKDNTNWSQPSDPLLLKVKQLEEYSNAYDPDLFAHEYVDIY